MHNRVKNNEEHEGFSSGWELRESEAVSFFIRTGLSRTKQPGGGLISYHAST